MTIDKRPEKREDEVEGRYTVNKAELFYGPIDKQKSCAQNAAEKTEGWLSGTPQQPILDKTLEIDMTCMGDDWKTTTGKASCIGIQTSRLSDIINNRDGPKNTVTCKPIRPD